MKFIALRSILARSPRLPRSYRPCLEALESRTLLSVFTVDRLTDLGEGSDLNGDLRYCLTQAQDGDLITFGVQGTITLTSGELSINKNLDIEGPGADILTVSGNHASRVFDILGPSTVFISGLTIADGLVSSGAGGGIFNGATLTVTDCVISGNTATGSSTGGGVGNLGTLTLFRSTVSGNTADGAMAGGGGIINFFGTMTITDSTVSGNTTPGNGGGINNNNNGIMVITGSTISGNSATDPSSGFGGGIINFATLTVTNCTVADNNAAAFAGGIATGGVGQLTVTSSTIQGNVAGFGGGGLDSEGAAPTVSNTILAGNAGASSPDVRGPLASEGHNLIGNGSGGSGFADTDLVGTADKPIDPMLGPLQDNGGPTPTMALLPGSPALNAGDPAQLGNPDQRGVVRTGGVNIGAYQASASAFLVSAPDTVDPGVPFDMTVTAVDSFGQTAVGYTGTVTFTTTDSDPNVVLPADYSFTADDGGSHTFTDTGLGETTLITPGEQVITATDTADDTITGSATVTVNGTGPGRNPWQDRSPAALNPIGLARLFGSADRSLWDARIWAGMGEAVALAHRDTASHDNPLSL